MPDFATVIADIGNHLDPETLAAALGQCNLKLGLYGGLGAYLLTAGLLAVLERDWLHSREHVLHGLIYLTLGVV